MAADDPVQSDALGVTPAVAVDDLGKYRLIAKLARGGMGVVHLALLRGPAGFNKLLVVKELRREFAKSDELVASFMDEARLAARLNHPNIVQTIEVGTDAGRYFMAMEYLEGQSLQRLFYRASIKRSPLPLQLQLGLHLDVLAALDYAHRLTDFGGAPLGVVHRDVSPPNILVTYEGQIKLLDFGIAKTIEGPEDREAGVLKGKARYMAPEQAAACGRVDRRADLFSVGVMLWEATAGRRLWEGMQDADVLRSLLAGVIPEIRYARPDVDPALAAIVERAMSVNPDLRYPTALAMRDDLERYMVARGMSLLRTRRLGAAASSLFSTDRQKLRELIDAQLRALDAGGDSRPPSQAYAQLTASLSCDAKTVEGGDDRPGQASGPSTADAPPLTLPTFIPTAESAPQSDAAPSPLWVEPRPAASAPRGWLIAAAGALGALVALTAFVAGRSSIQGLAARPAGVVGAPPVVSADAPPRVVHVVVRASPPTAQMFLDDETIENPYVADRARDERAHLVRVEALGYATKTATLTFSADVSVDFALALVEPTVSRSHGGGSAAASASAGPSSSSSSPAAIDAPPRPIVVQNPYPIAPSGP
jgi:eukaryotic-like serine/threonine-protein kinase